MSSVPPNPEHLEWLWVGWFNTKWTRGPDGEEHRTDVILYPRLVILTGDAPPILTSVSGPRFYIHKDLIDE